MSSSQDIPAERYGSGGRAIENVTLSLNIMSRDKSGHLHIQSPKRSQAFLINRAGLEELLAYLKENLEGGENK